MATVGQQGAHAPRSPTGGSRPLLGCPQNTRNLSEFTGFFAPPFAILPVRGASQSFLKTVPIVRSVRNRIKIYYRKLRIPLKVRAGRLLGLPNRLRTPFGRVLVPTLCVGTQVCDALRRV